VSTPRAIFLLVMVAVGAAGVGLGGAFLVIHGRFGSQADTINWALGL
jgi:hypothetical protein